MPVSFAHCLFKGEDIIGLKLQARTFRVFCQIIEAAVKDDFRDLT